MEDQHSTPYLPNPASIHDRTNRRRSRLSLSLSCIIHYSLHSFLCVILGAYTFFKLIVILTFQYIFLFLNTSLYISLSLNRFFTPQTFSFLFIFHAKSGQIKINGGTSNPSGLLYFSIALLPAEWWPLAPLSPRTPRDLPVGPSLFLCSSASAYTWRTNRSFQKVALLEISAYTYHDSVPPP
jgi:hypothetical protein